MRASGHDDAARAARLDFFAMRILLIGSRKSWRMERGVDNAFRRMGHETLLIDDRRLKRLFGRAITQRIVRWRARQFDAEFVFLSKCLALDLETVEQVIRGRRNAMWYHDPQWYRDLERPDVAHIAAVGRLATTFHISGFENEWKANGLNAKFLPAAADRMIVPVTPNPAYAAEASFIGTGYDPDRAAFLSGVGRQVKLQTWGRGWEQWREAVGWRGRPVEGEAFARVCSSSGVVLGVNPTRAAGATTYASDRMWFVCLAGGFYLGERTSGIDRMLLEGVHCDWYSGLDECVEKVRRWNRDSAERERVRAAGEAFVREHHSFDDRVRYLLSGERWINPLD